MSDHRDPGRVVPFEDEAEIRQRLAEAGPRPPLPEEDLDEIAAAAHAAWQRSWGAGESENSGDTSNGGPSDRRRGAPLLRQLGLIAAVAALTAALGLTVFWLTMNWMSDDRGAARVTALRGTAWVGGPVDVTRAPPHDGGGGKALTAGDAVGWGEVVTVAADGGTALDLRLDGGTELRLAPGSRLAVVAGPGSEAPFEAFFQSVSELFAPAPRPVHRLSLETGALYVDTGRHGSPVSRLAVETPLGTVRDVGTRFSVRLRPGGPAGGEPALEVRVRSGAVVLERGAADGGDVRAEAGEELTVAADGQARVRPADAFGDSWRWAVDQPPGFTLEGSTVHAFLCWVSDETGWELRYADPETEAAAREITLHGDLGPLLPDRAALALLPSAGMRAEVVAGTLVVRLEASAARRP